MECRKKLPWRPVELDWQILGVPEITAVRQEDTGTRGRGLHPCTHWSPRLSRRREVGWVVTHTCCCLGQSPQRHEAVGVRVPDTRTFRTSKKSHWEVLPSALSYLRDLKGWYVDGGVGVCFVVPRNPGSRSSSDPWGRARLTGEPGYESRHQCKGSTKHTKHQNWKGLLTGEIRQAQRKGVKRKEMGSRDRSGESLCFSVTEMLKAWCCMTRES